MMRTLRLPSGSGLAPCRWKPQPASASVAATSSSANDALADEGVQRYVDGKPIRKFIYVPGKLANVVV
jgi:leucyl-tRNA synthetase